MRKPSAALVVATAALVMATVGTSVAANHYLITSSEQIKPGSISLADLSKNARKALHGARGPAGQAGQDGEDGLDGLDGQDGIDGVDATDLWAQVTAGGVVNASSPGVTAVNTGTGLYDVSFGTDITQCAALATQGSIPNFAGTGTSTTGIPGPAFVSAASAGVDFAPGFPSVSSVAVQTRRTNGSLASTSFTIAVFC